MIKFWAGDHWVKPTGWAKDMMENGVEGASGSGHGISPKMENDLKFL